MLSCLGSCDRVGLDWVVMGCEGVVVVVVVELSCIESSD